jgi:tetratricopeptide (TPR) repeat protein
LNVFRSFDIESSLHSPWPWLVVAAVVAALWLRKREPVAAFLILWWPLGLLPALDIRNLSFPLLAERFTYVPSVSLCLLIAWALFVWLPRKLPTRRWERIVAPAFAVAAIYCAAQTLRAIPNWRSNESLANYSMKQSPDAALLHLIQGFVLQYKEGDLAGSRREFETAMRLNAQSPRPLSKVTYDSYIGLGMIAQREGNNDLAVDYLEKATRVSPYDSPAYDALGAIYFPRGDYAKAAEYFSQAVRANPYDLNGRFYLGTCWLKMGKYAEAAQQFRAAREVDPSFLAAYEAEARALESSGMSDEAARVRRMAPRP